MSFSIKKVLRFAIVLLGLQLTGRQVAEVGVGGLAIIVATLFATLGFSKFGAGTSICGASAVIAVNTCSEAADEDVAYAVARVTVFCSIAMFAYQLLPDLLHLTPRAYGLGPVRRSTRLRRWSAAPFQAGKTAGDYGTIAKLTRVTMLAPVVMALGLIAARSRTRDAADASRCRSSGSCWSSSSW